MALFQRQRQEESNDESSLETAVSILLQVVLSRATDKPVELDSRYHMDPIILESGVFVGKLEVSTEAVIARIRELAGLPHEPADTPETARIQLRDGRHIACQFTPMVGYTILTMGLSRG